MKELLKGLIIVMVVVISLGGCTATQTQKTQGPEQVQREPEPVFGPLRPWDAPRP
jgi:hypothetical protein